MACKNFVLTAYPISFGSPRQERYLNEKDGVYKPRFFPLRANISKSKLCMLNQIEPHCDTPIQSTHVCKSATLED